VDQRLLFVDTIPSRDRLLHPTYHFMMRCLLCSRVETGLASDPAGQDEDVQLYLASLLRAFVNPESVERVPRGLSPYDHEVLQRLTRSNDASLKYTIYRTSTDFLLVSLGFFDEPDAARSGRRRARSSVPAEEATMGRGRMYYQFAYVFAQQIYRKNGAVPEVLEKLSRGFDRYLRALAHMRGERLDLFGRLAQGEVYHLERSVSQESRRSALRVHQDDFLDAYLEWQRDRSASNRERLLAAARRVQEMDPTFRFEFPD
jgi:hypothetical protein